MQSAINIATIVKSWLTPENAVLQKAIERTVEEGLFSCEDIEFQLSVLRDNIENGEIEEWVNRTGLSSKKNANGRKVLCLHAGNLPLVGFQTALGTILTGADYYGKLSRKDPYLLTSFLEEVKKSGLDQVIQYSTDLNQFKDLKAEKVVFAGSQESVLEVKEEIAKISAAKNNANYIIRTAKFSMAYLSDWNKETKKDLVEAMLRYGGKGCRSVAVVVASFELGEIKDELKNAVQAYWKENPQHLKPTPDVKYQYAYKKSLDADQLWLQDFLIQETRDIPETDFTVNWVKGDVEKVRELRMKLGELVQSVYTTGAQIEGLKTEPLFKAQKPPIWWNPDGVDLIEALIK
ncbi:MAG: acyl-CoA reductase [Gracilimonas sp.]